ncbi:MAG: sensor domain-containing diguanylate cyclase [Candidatus Omnitrophota bacterium]
MANFLIAAFLYHRHSLKVSRLDYQAQALEEEFNLLSQQNKQEFLSSNAYQEKIMRYNSLKKVIEEINSNLDLEFVADNLTLIASSLISKDKGACILYLVGDPAEAKLRIFRSRKEDKNLIIKAKEGDIFDFWVLRHASSLLIEDAKKDFRFDLDRLKQQDSRPIGSLISSPLISKSHFLGVMRLDNPVPNFYTQEDLRFLVSICDLGAVALENSQLFKKTEELAIHDGLTSLFTKGYFMERLKEELKRSVRQKKSISLLMLDIDFFKHYNDKFGHTAGDIVLKSLGEKITEHFKGTPAVISRFGGEEFCIFIPGTEKKGAVSVAESLRKDIEKQKVVLRRQETGVTVSVGVSASPEDSSDEEDLIFKADKAMYAAKNKGRNRIACCS